MVGGIDCLSGFQPGRGCCCSKGDERDEKSKSRESELHVESLSEFAETTQKREILGRGLYTLYSWVFYEVYPRGCSGRGWRTRKLTSLASTRGSSVTKHREGRARSATVQ